MRPMTAESKRERFTRIAAKRTRQILDRLRILGNCSNRSGYEYSAEDVEKIFAAIERQMGITRSLFEDRGKKIDFKL